MVDRTQEAKSPLTCPIAVIVARLSEGFFSNESANSASDSLTFSEALPNILAKAAAVKMIAVTASYSLRVRADTQK